MALQKIVDSMRDVTVVDAAKITTGAVPTAALSNVDLVEGTKGADIASAGTTVIGTDGGYFDITGTTGITAMTVAAGRVFTLQFDGVVTLTHSATLYLSGAANFTTEANDHMTFISVAANDVRQIGTGLKDGGSPVAAGGITLGTVADSGSGTSIDFTGIPAGTKRITMNFDDVETNGTSAVMLLLGDAGGFEASGYLGCSVRVSGDADAEQARAFTEGMALQSAAGATSPMFGSIMLSLLDPATFTWSSMAVLGRQDVYLWVASSAKSLSAELTQVRLTMINGSDAFDDGKLNISYE